MCGGWGRLESFLAEPVLGYTAHMAVRIKSRKNSELMNSKSEFNHPPIARIVVEKKPKYNYKSVKGQLSPNMQLNSFLV